MTDQKFFNLTLIRHGQTVANVHRIIQGHSDTPLTELGIEQAELLGDFFSRPTNHRRFNRVYTSDQGRAMRTCEIVCSKIGVSTSLITRDYRLRERKYGQYEGRPIHEFQLEAYEHGYTECNFTQYTPEGIESMEQVMSRVRDFLLSLCRECEAEDDILVVSHWATVKEFLKTFKAMSNGTITNDHLVETPNAAFTKLRIGFTTNHISSVQVICLHSTAHLMADQTSVNIRHSLD